MPNTRLVTNESKLGIEALYYGSDAIGSVSNGSLIEITQGMFAEANPNDAVGNTVITIRNDDGEEAKVTRVRMVEGGALKVSKVEKSADPSSRVQWLVTAEYLSPAELAALKGVKPPQRRKAKTFDFASVDSVGGVDSGQPVPSAPPPPISTPSTKQVINGSWDTDKDGVPNVIDKDDDNDGIPDVQDPNPTVIDAPTNGPSALDKDSDADGVPDVVDRDDDNDGIPDSLDRDDDGDGIPDAMDASGDDMVDPTSGVDITGDDMVDPESGVDTSGDDMYEKQDTQDTEEGETQGSYEPQEPAPLETDHYAMLGVPSDADEYDIRKAFRRKALELHPDRNHAPDAEERFKEINAAYQLLKDAGERAAYDQRNSGRTMGVPREATGMDVDADADGDTDVVVEQQPDGDAVVTPTGEAELHVDADGDGKTDAVAEGSVTVDPQPDGTSNVQVDTDDDGSVDLEAKVTTNDITVGVSEDNTTKAVLEMEADGDGVDVGVKGTSVKEKPSAVMDDLPVMDGSASKNGSSVNAPSVEIPTIAGQEDKQSARMPRWFRPPRMPGRRR